jgi:hypothetical protein
MGRLQHDVKKDARTEGFIRNNDTGQSRSNARINVPERYFHLSLVEFDMIRLS